MNKKIIKNHSGQVTIEFIFAFSFSVIFLVFFLHYAFNYTIGYISHYATYSASRAYMSHDFVSRNPGTSLQLAREYAQKEFDNYDLKSFGVKSENGLQFRDPEQGKIYEYVGTHYSFSPPFVQQNDEGENLEFLSESFLGKEPLTSECGCQILNRLGSPGCQGDEFDFSLNEEITIYDNGC